MPGNYVALMVLCVLMVLVGLWTGWACWGRDAARWRWWRERHQALCTMDCASRAGLDLSRTYVRDAQAMDLVTDEALRKARASAGY